MTLATGISETNKSSEARVCQTCGDKGFEELLLRCSKCQISEEHRYCLAEIPKVDDSFTYICAQCVLSAVKQTSFKQSLLCHSKPSRQSRDTLQRNDGPTAVIQDWKTRGANCSSSVSERVVAVETCDIPVSLQTPVSEPSQQSRHTLQRNEGPTAVIQDRKKRGANCSSTVSERAVAVETCDITVSLHTPVSEPFRQSRDTLQRNDGPTAVIQDRKKRGPSCISSVSESVVALETCDLIVSLQTPVSNPSVKDVLPEAGFNENDRSSHQSDVKSDGHQETKRKRRRLIHGACKKSDEVVGGVEDQQMQAIPVAAVEPIATCDPFNVPSQNPVHDDPAYVYAQPIIDPTWRGCFDIFGRKFGRFVAHLSSKACSKVVEAARLMPEALCITMIPRFEAWPKSFIASAPTDANIGLYFFPESERVVKPFDELTHDIIKRDFLLKVLLDNAELLIFPSNHLPPPYWRFKGKYYLWGVFRGRKELQSRESGNCSISAQGSKDFMESLRTSPCSPLSMKSGNMSDSPRSPLSLSNRVFALEKKKVH
ncbi:hypothetical protein AQUCO_01400402v1 [Aquilegia coerulea]|uniref:AIPP2-like SPOC-like domain-containing protein n=1 Tax=Aquilegia coerulea TaxID=218851 RepID=A0A2G5DW86_AQUCA|nr:hypothetical protein AQUCO_01400402v1 [Aquilegia coerulea]